MQLQDGDPDPDPLDSETQTQTLADTPSTSTSAQGPRKRRKPSLDREIFSGETVVVRSPLGIKLVTKAEHVIGEFAEKYLQDDVSVKSQLAKRIAPHVAKVGGDLVAWGITKKMTPDDDEAQPFMDTFNRAVDMAIERSRAVKLTGRQRAKLLGAVVTDAAYAIREFLMQTLPNGAEWRARIEALDEEDYREMGEATVEDVGSDKGKGKILDG